MAFFLKIMDWEGSVCLPRKIVWTTIIEGEAGGYPGDISESSVMIRPVHFLQYCNYFEYDFQT